MHVEFGFSILMNILYDYQTFTLQAQGGISRYFFELIQRIGRNAHVSVFMGVHINDCGLERSRDEFRQFFGFKMREIPHTLGLRLWLNAFLLSRFANRMNDGIYHQTYFYNHLPHWKGKRVVTVYDMIYELYPKDYDANDPTATNKAAAVNRADRVICISEHTRRGLIEILRVPEEKISVVYLANSLTCEVQSPAVLSTPYLLYVGKRGGYKNFKTLLRAFARASALRREFKLVCFGGGDFTKDERELMNTLEVSEQIEIRTGSDAMLANLYKHASALVYPSLCEGFGMPPLEAMHYNCPVVVSRASSIPEVVADAGVYFDPSSEEDIAEKIQLVVSDTSLRSTLVARGAERKRQFTWDRCAEETLKIYEHVL
jgi:glycosyltransferase involved in cell wall biosynthesis